jgi:hypothetical protein
MPFNQADGGKGLIYSTYGIRAGGHHLRASAVGGIFAQHRIIRWNAPGNVYDQPAHLIAVSA